MEKEFKVRDINGKNWKITANITDDPVLDRVFSKFIVRHVAHLMAVDSIDINEFMECLKSIKIEEATEEPTEAPSEEPTEVPTDEATEAPTEGV